MLRRSQRLSVLTVGVVGLASVLGAGTLSRPAVIVQDFANRSYELRHDWFGIGLAYLVRKNLSALGSLDLLEDRRAKPGEVNPFAEFVIEGEVRLDETASAADAKFVVFVTLNRLGEGAVRRQFLTEGAAAQMFDMAEYLTDRISKHLEVAVSDAERARFGRGMTRNLVAFQHFAEAIVERRIHAKLEAYERALLLDPAFAEANFHLGRVHTVLRNYEEAESQLRRALEIVPEFAQAHNDLAYVLAQRDKLPEAEREYRKAIEAVPTDPKYLLNLADLLRHRGELSEAKGHYEAVLRLSPGHPEAIAGLSMLGAPVAIAAAGSSAPNDLLRPKASDDPPARPATVAAPSPRRVEKPTVVAEPVPTPRPRLPRATPEVTAKGEPPAEPAGSSAADLPKPTPPPSVLPKPLPPASALPKPPTPSPAIATATSRIEGDPEPVAPEVAAPEVAEPEAVAPEAVAPEAVAPEAVAPEAVAPVREAAVVPVAPAAAAPSRPRPATGAGVDKQATREVELARKGLARARGDQDGMEALVSEAERAAAAGDAAAVFLALGRLYVSQASNYAAVDALEKALGHDSGSDEVRGLLATAYEAIGKRSQADALRRRAP